MDTVRLDADAAALVQVVQDLSLARSLDEITRIVRHAARKLANADGATFVLRDDEQCFYVDEDAISPLWKGMKFPMSTCISGWCMLHKEQVVIEDIYVDDRIPIDAYRPTFVKSLAMTPIRRQDPIGAIGSYWKDNYRPTTKELELLAALADTTSVAIANVSYLAELETRIGDLEKANSQLNRMTWMASHDLREPLRAINLHASLLQRQFSLMGGTVAPDSSTHQCLQHLERLKTACGQGNQMIESLLEIARVENHQLSLRTVDLNDLLDDVLQLLGAAIEEEGAQIQAANLPEVYADPVLLARVMQNLLSNAIKFHPPGTTPCVEIEAAQEASHWKITVRDHGIGIEPDNQHRIFEFFSRVQAHTEYSGSGIGLALCKTIVEGFEGKIWVESTVGEGSEFHFTLPRSAR